MPLSITSNNDIYVGPGTTTMKMGFYGTTPVDQAAAITSPGTTGATSTTPVGFTTTTQADAINTAVRSILVALREVGIIAT